MNLIESIASAPVTASGSTGWFDAVNVDEVTVGVDVTAVSGTAPSAQFALDVLGADGNAYTLWTSAAVTAAGEVAAVVNIGAAGAVRLRWAITGTTPSFTFSASLEG